MILSQIYFTETDIKNERYVFFFGHSIKKQYSLISKHNYTVILRHRVW